MKTVFFVACVMLFELFWALNSFGQEVFQAAPVTSSKPLLDSNEINFEKLPLNKLTRGITNTTFFWLEAPAQMCQTAKEAENELVGGSLGLMKGIFTSFLRALTGIIDVATFIIPPYDRPLMDPEYVFSRFNP